MTDFCHVSELRTGPSKREGACSILSQRSAEPLAGTAYTGDRWLLIEHPGPWPSQAVDESLPAELLAEIRQRAPGVRLALIRRPGVRRVDRPAVFLTGGRPDSWMRRVELGQYQGIRRLNLEALARGEEPYDGQPVAEPTFFVCTHGKREICCAEFGRPVLRAIANAGLPAWEITHIGGDRFAASMVVFPQGDYFGHLSPLSGLSAARNYREGTLQMGNFRGRSGYPNSVQAAEIFLREQLGVHQVDDVGITGWSQQEQEAVVDLDCCGSTYQVTLSSHEHPEQLINGCGADAVHIPRKCWVAQGCEKAVQDHRIIA